jgi:hypothetical protein
MYSGRERFLALIWSCLAACAKTLTLPVDERVRILAVTASDESDAVRPAQPLFDSLERRTP